MALSMVEPFSLWADTVAGAKQALRQEEIASHLRVQLIILSQVVVAN